MLVVNPALQVNVALVVDRLLGLRGADDFISTAIEPAQDAPQASAGIVAASYTDSAGGSWQVCSCTNWCNLQTSSVFASDRFDSSRLSMSLVRADQQHFSS